MNLVKVIKWITFRNLCRKGVKSILARFFYKKPYPSYLDEKAVSDLIQFTTANREALKEEYSQKDGYGLSAFDYVSACLTDPIPAQREVPGWNELEKLISEIGVEISRVSEHSWHSVRVT